MYIAHIRLNWGESQFFVGSDAREIFNIVFEAQGIGGVLSMSCSDEDWFGAALNLGNIEQIRLGQTGCWTNGIDEIFICHYEVSVAKNQTPDRLTALRGAVAVAADNDRLLDGMDFSGMEMDEIRKDWTGFTFSGCNLSGACFSGCNVVNAAFIECDITGCWFQVTDITNVTFSDCIDKA